jgi:hypothetical protein
LPVRTRSSRITTSPRIKSAILQSSSFGPYASRACLTLCAHLECAQPKRCIIECSQNPKIYQLCCACAGLLTGRSCSSSLTAPRTRCCGCQPRAVLVSCRRYLRNADCSRRARYGQRLCVVLSRGPWPQRAAEMRKRKPHPRKATRVIARKSRYDRQMSLEIAGRPSSPINIP